MTNYKTRELPRVAEALTHEEPRMMYRKIIKDVISFLYEALLTSLCFLHSVEPMKLVEIKLSSIDVDKKKIE